VSDASNTQRISFDQQYKHLIRAFFAEFVRLFDPDTAAGIDLSTVTFRDAEVFTDIPQGERRTADVVAEVWTRDGRPRLVIIHIEIQRKRERHFNRRMWEYFAAFHLRENVPVIPIALVFYPAREGIGREEYEVAAFGHTIMSFRYLRISLPCGSGRAAPPRCAASGTRDRTASWMTSGHSSLGTRS